MQFLKGLPDERFVVKPNPVPDPGPPAAVGQGAVYVGRLSPEKGVRLLLEAWRELEGESLTVVGTGGPKRTRVARRNGFGALRSSDNDTGSSTRESPLG